VADLIFKEIKNIDLKNSSLGNFLTEHLIFIANKALSKYE